MYFYSQHNVEAKGGHVNAFLIQWMEWLFGSVHWVWLSSNNRKLLKTCRQHYMLNCLDWNRHRHKHTYGKHNNYRRYEKWSCSYYLRFFLVFFSLLNSEERISHYGLHADYHVFPRFTWRAFITSNMRALNIHTTHLCSPFKCWIV